MRILLILGVLVLGINSNAFAYSWHYFCKGKGIKMSFRTQDNVVRSHLSLKFKDISVVLSGNSEIEVTHEATSTLITALLYDKNNSAIIFALPLPPLAQLGRIYRFTTELGFQDGRDLDHMHNFDINCRGKVIRF